ncbi:hypothetical protein [Streptomyces sp. NPDC001537]
MTSGTGQRVVVRVIPCGAWDAVPADPVACLRPVGLSPMTVFGLVVVLTALPLRQGLVNAESAG